MALIGVVLAATLIALALMMLVLFFTYRTAGAGERRGACPRCSCRSHPHAPPRGEPCGGKAIPVGGLLRLDTYEHEDHPG